MIVLRVALLPVLPVPVPGIHDEFSYLLMSDTFAHGRLANPSHPMWMSFETFHVNWFPTYSSKYPPAQGFAMAFGQLLGNPWIGILLSDAAMCAAILWMLQGWLPPRWALLGGILAALKFGLASYWMNSYWGGAVAALGGALVLGALGRILRQPHVRDAVLMGIGIAILANSRPYEGLILCVPAGVVFLRWLFTSKNSGSTFAVRARQIVLPLAAILCATFAFMGYYNLRLTGHALLFPHVLNTRTYHTGAALIWEEPKPEKHYNNEQFEDYFNNWEQQEYGRNWDDFKEISKDKLERCGSTFFWSGLLLLLPGAPLLYRDRGGKLFLVTLVLVTVGVFVVVYSNAHYAAPITTVLFALFVQAMRHLRTMRLGTFALGTALVSATIALLVFDTASNIVHRRCDPLAWVCQGDPSRVAVENTLERMPGKHLIMVRYYEPQHNIHDEWVYNRADIDGAKVVWAREISPEQDAKLFSYFKDRKVWLVEPDTDNTELVPYKPPPAAPSK